MSYERQKSLVIEDSKEQDWATSNLPSFDTSLKEAIIYHLKGSDKHC